MRKEVIVLIGLPGSGKSTFIRGLYKPFVCSTDHYFMVNGEYQFDSAKLEVNHLRNFQRFAMAVADRVPLVVVDNTNLLRAYREPYCILADALGYDVKLVVVGNFDEQACQMYADRNTHGVPLDKIQKMAQSVEFPTRSYKVA